MAPSNVSVGYVEKPSEEIIDEAVQIFCGLMPDDPAAVAFVGGNISLIPAMAKGMIRPLALISGEMYAATDEDGTLVGFTLWTPPGKALFNTEDQLKEGWMDFVDLLSDEAKGYYAQSMGVEWPAFLDRSLGIENATLNTYYCHFAFVRADYQGKGVAKALFELVFEKARRLRTVTALGTTNEVNVIKYSKIGLENKGHIVIPSPWRNWPGWAFMKDFRESAGESTA